jgi:triosephosphate isomerase
MRRLTLIGNWKMHTTPSSARDLASQLRDNLKDISDADLGICPPATSIAAVADVLKDTNIAWGAQNAHWAESGAFTGEIPADALKELGCTYVIVGHSERRHLFGEGDEMVARRLHFVQEKGLIAVLCVGETEPERVEGKTEVTLDRQLSVALNGLEHSPSIIAYEPVWAIGTGRRAEIEDIEAAHRFIREKIAGRFGGESETLRLLYGGSVKPDNVADLMDCGEIDGALVGGASLSAESFAALVARAIERRKL